MRDEQEPIEHRTLLLLLGMSRFRVTILGLVGDRRFEEDATVARSLADGRPLTTRY
jgi:hypothetical protein